MSANNTRSGHHRRYPRREALGSHLVGRRAVCGFAVQGGGDGVAFAQLAFQLGELDVIGFQACPQGGDDVALGVGDRRPLIRGGGQRLVDADLFANLKSAVDDTAGHARFAGQTAEGDLGTPFERLIDSRVYVA